MNNQSKTLTIIFIVFMIPIVLYSFFEITSLKEDETMIKSIYNNQLDAILFSVNQTSNDIVNAWSQKIVVTESGSKDSICRQLISEINSIEGIILFNEANLEGAKIFYDEGLSAGSAYDQIVAKTLKNNWKTIQLLPTLLENGYRKLEPIGIIQSQSDDDTHENLLVFALNKHDNFKYAVLLINPDLFIEQSLSPKLQTIGQENIILAAYNGSNNNLIYATEEISVEPSGLQRAFWLFPNFYLRIELRGQSLESLVQKRAFTNIALLVILNLLIIVGIWVVMRNMKKALHLAQSKSDFVSNVSHEIRTPLSLISMFAETLELNRVHGEKKKMEYYHIIGQEANRLSKMVNKILNFAKIEADKKIYHYQPEELNNIVCEILKVYEYHLENKGFKHDFDQSKEALPVSVDKQSMEEAIINIIDNAIKYSEKMKFISIKTGKVEDRVFVSIKDQGIGISNEDKNQIFNKFYRASKGEIHNTKGTGLGLTLVKHIVDAHRGSIEVKSQWGKGSKFTIWLPVNQHQTT